MALPDKDNYSRRPRFARATARIAPTLYGFRAQIPSWYCTGDPRGRPGSPARPARTRGRPARPHRSARLARPRGRTARTHNPLMLSVLLFLLFALVACDTPTITIGGATSPTPNDIPGSVQLNRWYTVAPDAQVRYEDWKTSDGDNDTVTIARFDPHDISLS